MSTAAALPAPAFSADRLLGGRKVLHRQPRTPLEWVDMIRQGISSTTIDVLAKTLHLSQSELATALAIPERTLARRKKEGTLSSEESAKVVRLARVVERAEEVFEDLVPTLDWLKSSNATLGGETPLSLLDTDIGAQTVMDTLGRIEHGVYG